MVARDESGRFIKGNGGGPGRPPKEREERYREVLLTTVTFKDWQEIVEKAAQQAKRGDAVARKWLSDYLVGQPVQRSEITGANGGDVVLRVIYDRKEPNA